jgi:rSAM/selenodomain-associated transferase 1
MKNRLCVQVFARGPIEGTTKTRLIPLLGADGAAELQRRLVMRTLSTALEARIGPVELWCAPSQSHEFFAACAAKLAVSLHDQVEGDLGVRMESAMADALLRFNAVILVGCDCPAFSADDFRQAADALHDGTHVVLTPVEDGGYSMIGASRIDLALFAGMAWGTDRVVRDTRTRLAALNWKWKELRTLWDVDRPQDVERLRQEKTLCELVSAL